MARYEKNKGRIQVKVFITGSTGFLGRHIVTHFIKNGFSVIAGVRNEKKGEFISKLGGEIRVCFLEDTSSLVKGVEDAEVVIHSATLVAQGGKWKNFYRVNVEGTANLLKAMKNAGVKRLVYISTVGVYGLRVHLKEIEVREDYPLITPSSLLEPPYSYTKAVAENIVTSSEMDWTVLRPGIIFGEWDRFFIPSILRIMRRGVIPLFGSGNNPLHIVYAGNVALMCELAIRKRITREIFHAVDTSLITYRDFMLRLSLAMGYSIRMVRVPFLPAKILAFLMEILSYFLGYNPFFSRLALYPLYNRAVFLTKKAERILGWRSEVGFEDALKRVVGWYRSEGF